MIAYLPFVEMPAGAPSGGTALMRVTSVGTWPLSIHSC